MPSLCAALGITVNDLLSGEYVSERDYQKKAEENMMELMKQNAENKLRMAQSLTCGAVTIVAVCALVCLASFLPLPVAARIALLAFAIATAVAGIWAAATLDVRAGWFECPHCKELFVPPMAGLRQGLPHLYQAPPDLPPLRTDGHVPPPGGKVKHPRISLNTSLPCPYSTAFFTQAKWQSGLLSIGLLFNPQQFAEILKQRSIRRLEHDPFPIMVCLRLLVYLLRFFCIILARRFKFQALIPAKDNHKTHAVFPCIQCAQGFASSPVFILIRPRFSAFIPQTLHIV